jgi:hypothetical protein
MAVHTKAPDRPADLELMNGKAATAVAPLSGQQFLPASLHFGAGYRVLSGTDIAEEFVGMN